MRLRNLLFILLICFCVLPSCGDDTPGCDLDDFNQRVLDAFNEAFDAGQAWGSDPSAENCQTWKNATNAYLNTIENFNASSCDGINQAEYDQMLQEARDAVNAVNC